MAEGKPRKIIRVDKDSIEYLLGEINTRLDNQNGRMDRMSNKITKLTFVIITAAIMMCSATIGAWVTLG